MTIDTSDPQVWQPGFFDGNPAATLLPSPMRDGLDPAGLASDPRVNPGDPDAPYFRLFVYPGEVRAGDSLPTIGGRNPDRPYWGAGGAPVGWSTLRRDIDAQVWTGGPSPAGQWVCPADLDQLGHYSVLLKRGTPQAPVSHPYFREHQGFGLLAVIRRPESLPHGYMERPPATEPVGGGNQNLDVPWAWFMGQGAPRVSLNYGAGLDNNLNEAASLVAQWEQFYKNAPTRDQARPHAPVTLLHVNLMPGDEAQFRAICRDPRFKGKGVTHELGNERFGDVRQGPGGGNLGVGPPGFDLVDMTVQMAHAAKEEDPACRVGTPTATGIGEQARAGITAYLGDPRIKALVAGGLLDTFNFHTYNSHGGSMSLARQSCDVLLDVRRTTGCVLPMVNAEAGNFGSTRSGVGTAKAQAWQVMVDLFMWERLSYLDSLQGGAGCSKETRSEFHLMAGFLDHPGWWRLGGPWIAPVHALVHSQELKGCAQVPVGMVDVGEDDRDNIWALLHRRADGSRTLAILAGYRDERCSFRIAGAGNRSVEVVGRNGDVRTVALDATGAGELLNNALSGRGATYVRLPADMAGAVTRVPRSTPGARVPASQLQIFTNGGSYGNTRLADVKDPDKIPNSLLYDVPQETGTSLSQWRSGLTLAQAGPAGLWVELLMRAPARVHEIRMLQAPAHEVMGTVITARFEALVDGVWELFGDEIDDTEQKTPHLMPNQLYLGGVEQVDDYNHDWRAVVPEGVVATSVRFRVYNKNGKPGATFGFMNSVDVWHGLGLKIPVLDTDDAPGAFPPRHLHKAKIVAPVPADQASNFWGWGMLQESANEKQTGFPAFFDVSDTSVSAPALWMQDLRVFASPAPDGPDGGSGPGPMPNPLPPLPPLGRYRIGGSSALGA